MLLWYLFVFVIVFQTFVDLHRAFSLKRQTVVTCISTLKKSHDEEKAVSCLILGTESSMIYILDPEAFTILDTLIVPAPPSHLGRSESTPSFEITTYIWPLFKILTLIFINLLFRQVQTSDSEYPIGRHFFFNSDIRKLFLTQRGHGQWPLWIDLCLFLI